ncbi:site-2 protease family protein [Erythrobacter ani]|uniref:Zinc metalloprotease n=1 Tax=Erythrobacter ani TaxID=2827235 RepID=A0ABS6SM40_9SPHN|nr:site-2 protease family protein [Erythrobacter ani]MBV7265493.1 site-2 protease family protein [Erythrobacter ani]
MPRSFPIASIKGTAVRLHWTFVLVLALITLIVLISNGALAAAQVFLLVSLVFVCVVLHEFGHITVARQFGIETPEVILLPMGGLAKLQRIPSDPRQELAIAIAGPAVNFALFALLILFLGRWPDWGTLAGLAQGEINFVEQLAIFNLVVGLFNLLPAFPMDGGRIFRALLAFAMPHHKATRIAARVGQALAVVLGVVGLMAGNVVLAAIAVFVFLAATSEANLEKIRHAIGGTPVRNVMVTGQAQFLVTDHIGKAADAILASDNEEFPVLELDGRLAGFVLRADVLESIGDAGPEASICTIMRTDLPVVSLQHRAEKVAETIAGGAPIVGVIDSRGRFAGLVNWRNLLDALAIDEALRQQHRNRQTRFPL